MSYKKLGNYIQVIDERNKELLDLPLLGVSVQKVFIPSIANTIGTDFSKYKIIYKNQFTYIPDTSRRGDKIGVALLKSFDKALVSQAYTTFKIIDENQLNPDYLMMWFTRPEFDRYARYHSIGSVREVFDWEDMCNVELPIPSIEKQREIVAQYQAVENKIKVNEQICEKLEAAAQALYKHWFVDFEFPYSPPQEGCPQDGVVNANVPRSTQNYKSLPFNPALKERAKELRKAGNLAEVLFWQQVRNRQFKGLDFDRQKIIGNYIVDFYNANYQLVVEIDGSSHNDKQEYDASRQRYLEELGVKVVRYTDIEVKRDIVSVMQHLSDYIDTIQQISPQAGETNHTLQARESNLPAFQEEEINLPAFQAPLQRRGMMGYKSSGGKMVWNEELEKEIPEGWEVKSLKQIGKVITGKTPSSSNPEDFGKEFQFVTPSDFVGKKVIIDSSRKLSLIGKTRLENKINPKNTVLVTCIGSDMGKVSLCYDNCITNQQINSLIGKKEYYSEFLYYKLVEIKDELKSLAVGGSTMPMLSKSQFELIEILMPKDELLKQFANSVSSITNNYSNYLNQNQKLTELQSLLLSRLARLEG